MATGSIKLSNKMEFITIVGQTSPWSDESITAIKNAYANRPSDSMTSFVVQGGGARTGGIMFKTNNNYGNILFLSYDANHLFRYISIIGGEWSSPTDLI